MTVEHRPIPPWARRQEIRIGAVIAVALAIGFVVWLVAIRGGGSSKAKITTIAPTAATPERMSEVAKDAGHPVYWAGAEPGKKYELTITSDQNIYIRYLDPGTPIGAKDVASLTVGTYPAHDATAALQHEATKPGASTQTAPGGAFVLTNSNIPESVYLAYPNSDYEIEVYDPDPRKALSLATSGAIVPIR